MAANFKIKICIVCGKEFKTQSAQRTMCSDECKRTRKKQNARHNSQQERDLNKASFEAVAYEYKRPIETLAEFNGKARERGMTYGQYYTWRHFHKNNEVIQHE